MRGERRNLQTGNYIFHFVRSPLKLWLLPCNNADTEQKFYFTNYDEEGIPPLLEEDMEEELEKELEETDQSQRHNEL